MAKFAVFITKGPYESNNALSALAFCRAAVSQGHTIEQIFFYANGSLIANVLSSFNSDEVNLQESFSEFAMLHKISLNVCTTAAIRRGIASEQDTADHANYHPSYMPVGMQEFFATLASTTNKVKVVQF